MFGWCMYHSEGEGGKGVRKARGEKKKKEWKKHRRKGEEKGTNNVDNEWITD